MKFYSSIYCKENYIYETYYENGERKIKSEEFQPEIYLPTKNATEFKDIYGNYQERKLFDSIRDYKQYMYERKEVSNFYYNGDIKFVIQYISRNYPHEIEYDLNQMKVWFLDIEVSSKKYSSNHIVKIRKKKK